MARIGRDRNPWYDCDYLRLRTQYSPVTSRCSRLLVCRCGELLREMIVVRLTLNTGALVTSHGSESVAGPTGHRVKAVFMTESNRRG
jgi:hypothetical protein